MNFLSQYKTASACYENQVVFVHPSKTNSVFTYIIKPSHLKVQKLNQIFAKGLQKQIGFMYVIKKRINFL